MKKHNRLIMIMVSLLIVTALFVSCKKMEETPLSTPANEDQATETVTIQQPVTELEIEPEEDTSEPDSTLQPEEDTSESDNSEPDSSIQAESETSKEETTTENTTPEPPVVVETGPPGKIILEQPVSAADGGSLSIDEGKITLEFPADSLPEDTEIKVRALSKQDIPEDAAGLNPLGDVYSFEPDGLQLNEPATITMILEPEELSDLGLPENSYPFLLAFIRDNNGMWDIAEDVVIEVDPATRVVSVTASIAHFSAIYLTSALGVTVSISPENVVGDVGGSWYSEISLSYIAEHGTADYAYISEIEYKTNPATVITTLGITKADTIRVNNGETKTLTPEPRYMCWTEGTGWYGADMVLQIKDALLYFHEMFGLEAIHGRLLQLRRADGSPGELVNGARLRVKGTCECVVPIIVPDPVTSPPPVPDPCFAGDTLVLMADGSHQYIADIKIGDTVQAYETSKSTIVTGTVVSLNNGKADYYYIINGNLKVTPPHPFYTVQEKWVKIEELEIGDEIITSDGKMAITSIEKVNAEISIFNINVAEFNNFFVSGDGEYFFLVHQGS